MGRRVLCLDCDGVIFNTVSMCQNILSEINYCCSDDFKDKIIGQAYKNNDMNSVNMYTQIHIITKDEVLEERKDIYKNRINYSEMYVLKNTYPGIIDIIMAIYETGYFNKIYITTHVNTVREAMAKKAFFSKYLPMVEVIAIPFKKDPYIDDKDFYFDNANRKRTNKPLEFFGVTNEDPESALFVDDTEAICKQAIELGSEAMFCNHDFQNPISLFYELLERIENEKNRTM